VTAVPGPPDPRGAPGERAAPGPPGALPVRRAARVILLGPDGRVLLLRYDDPPPNGRHWSTPGGGLNPAEDYPAAAIRELAEETGWADITLEREVYRQSILMDYGGRIVFQHERFYLARTSPAGRAISGVDPMHASDGIADWRWWSLRELDSAAEAIWPEDLGRLIRGVLAGPARPPEPGAADAPEIRIEGGHLVLRALRPDEIDAEWQAMVSADPMTIAGVPDEHAFQARLSRSGRLRDGWLDLAIDRGGACIGRIQTFVPEGRPRPPGTFDIGIGLREHARGRHHGREALRMLTDWLFEHEAAEVVEAPTDRRNAAMRRVFAAAGWSQAGTVTDHGREWVLYRITRRDWDAVRAQRS
jgi:RimJ/RimL family protein N-acetyltransferase/ADP-ribose pyrophosphatase YjhB (NUDIX family)